MKRLLLLAALVALPACSVDQPTSPDIDVTPSFTSDPNDDFHSQPHEPGQEGSHGRLGHVSWRRTGPLTAEFTYVVGFRRSFYRNPQVGSRLTLANTNFNNGQGSINPVFTVTFVDAANDWFEARATFTKSFSNPGPHNFVSSGCCRIGASAAWQHMNNGDQNYRYWGTVDLNYSGSAASTLPPVVTCAIGSLCTFYVPAGAPDGLTLRWRLATPAEMGTLSARQPGPPQAPNAATIDANTGLYSWDATGAALAAANTNRQSVYSTQVVIEGLNQSGEVVTQSMIDFLILLADIEQNAPPAFVLPTPADGTTFEVAPGDPLVLGLLAEDADTDDLVVINGLGMPAGATLQGFPANPTFSQFEFTPTAAQAGQSFSVSFTPTDSRGLGGSPRSYVIKVPDNRPPTAQVSGPAQADEGTNVSFDGSGSSDPDGDALTYAWTVNGSSAGGNSSNLSYQAVDGPGTLEVTLTVSDGKGGVSSATHTVTVNNVAPTVSAGPAVSIVSGETANFNGSFSDPGVNDGPWDYAWSFGQSGQAAAQGSVSGSQAFLEAGSYTISLDVTDKDGGTGTASTTLVVERLAVSCEVKPETINLKGDQQNNGKGKGGGAPSGMVILHCYSTATVDMTSLLAATGTLGDGAAEDTHVATRNNGTYYMSAEDLNDDGILDVVLHFNRADMIANGDLVAGMPSLFFKGTLGDGRQVAGSDAVRVIP